jgi:hypothetical protein
LRLRTAARERVVLFDKKPSVVSAPPAHLRTFAPWGDPPQLHDPKKEYKRKIGIYFVTVRLSKT